MAVTKNDTDIAVIEKIAMEPPKHWNVVLYNDNKTTMEFVVLVLMQIFHKSFEEAQDCMMTIHETGKGVAGTYSYEVASTKKEDTITVARANGFPLKAELEQN